MWSLGFSHYCEQIFLPSACSSFFLPFPINMSLWNLSYIRHHLFHYRTSVIFILWIPCWMDHLTRNLKIHCHGSCLTIPPSIFRLSTTLFKAPSFHLSLSLAIHIDSLFKQTTFFNFFALLIHCSFPLLFLMTMVFLFSNFSGFSIRKKYCLFIFFILYLYYVCFLA